MRSPSKQRGTIYVLVLGITTLLVAMGLAGAIMARTTIERSNLEQEQAQARVLAVSFMDYCHSRIDGTTLYRAIVVSGDWRPAEAFGEGSAEHMYVDEIDGTISGNNAQPFRMYVRVTVGNAVRVYSQEFIPGASNKLIRNPKSFRQEPAN